MLYSAEALVAAAFTTSAINAQITALNTALGTSAAAVAVAQNGFTAAPADASSFPSLTYWVGEGGSASEMKRQGKRDTSVSVKLLYLSRHATLASGKADIQVALEALQTVLETLRGQQHSSTGRYCVDVRDPEVEFVTYEVGGETARQGGELRCTLLMRTEGL